MSTVLALSTVAYVTGCSLIKVNGKPLGGGSATTSSAPAASPAAAPSPAAATASTPTSAGALPELCSDLGYRTPQDYSAADFANLSTTEDDAVSIAGRFVNMMCTSGKVVDRDKIMAAKAQWMRALELDDTDFIVLAARNKSLTYKSQDADDFPGPLSQLSNGYAASGLVELDQLGKRASMYSRFVVVDRCLQRTAEHNPLLRHILCTREPLDKAKAYAEIDSVKELNEGTRFRLRRMIRATAELAAKARADIAAQAKADPAIAKVIAIAEAQFKEWAAPSEARAKLIAQLEAMEAATKANKRSAFAGCDATTRAAWERHVKSLELPKVPSEHALTTFVTATLDSVEGFLAYEALQLCEAGLQDSGNHAAPNVVAQNVFRRGPRTATVAAWLAAASEIKFDSRELVMGSLLANGNLPRRGATSVGGDRRGGVIAAIGDSGSDVEITFKTVVEPREDCLHWRDTNTIVGFGNNGAPMYRRECLKWGVIKMDLTSKPLFVSKVMAHGLRPGMYLVGIERLAIAATAAPKSAKPVWVFGAAVK